MCHSLRLQAGLKHPKRREGGSGLHLFWNRLITKARRTDKKSHSYLHPHSTHSPQIGLSSGGGICSLIVFLSLVSNPFPHPCSPFPTRSAFLNSNATS